MVVVPANHATRLDEPKCGYVPDAGSASSARVSCSAIASRSGALAASADSLGVIALGCELQLVSEPNGRSVRGFLPCSFASFAAAREASTGSRFKRPTSSDIR